MYDELDPPFDLMLPAAPRAPVLVNAPHSGRVYPSAFLDGARLDPHALRRSEDAYVDELVGSVAANGVAFLRARFPRAYVDANREPYELDPGMFEGELPTYANVTSMRVAGGLGTIPRIVSEREEIYARRLPVDEALKRINLLYKPYHAALRDTLDALCGRFGAALLLDCHSMPSLRGTSSRRPDFVLGDRFGTSCTRLVIDIADARLRRMGYSVARNKPYAGGYITETYGQPARGIHALQIEINRALYMDERSFQKTSHFDVLQRDMVALIDELSSITASDLRLDEAAE